jgi:hypothetical protein
MRQDTKRILLMLCAVSSKKTLLGLWADLKAASKAEFESELARAQAALAGAMDAGPAQPARRRMQPPRDDRPASRIAHRLGGELGLSDREAVAALTSSLREKGVEADKIPDAGRGNLTDWLEALLERVSGAVVMGAAQRIGKS